MAVGRIGPFSNSSHHMAGQRIDEASRTPLAVSPSMFEAMYGCRPGDACV